METLEVHSKDFLVKWVHAPDNSIIDWQAKPLKKSINLAIYKKTEEQQVNNLKETTVDSFQPPPAPFLNDETSTANGPSSTSASHSSTSRLRSSSINSVNQFTDSNVYKTKSRSSTFLSNLSNSQLALVKDYHKLIADELIHGKFEVSKGGMFAFIFDNSFSKTTGKKVLFSTKMINSGSEMNGNGNIFRRKSPISKLTSSISHTPKKSIRFQKLSNELDENQEYIQQKEQKIEQSGESDNILRPKNGELLQSVLLKKRRKKLQGFTKRFFILNFKYGTLSYFRVNDNKLRGQMPIKQSIISANATNREIIIDSGMEIWDLKALNAKDFNTWIDAFNEIKKSNNELVDQEMHELIEEGEHLINELEFISTKLDKLKFETASAPRNVLADNIVGITKDIEKLIVHLRPNNKNSVITNETISILSSDDYYDAIEYIDAMNSGVVLLDQQNGLQDTIDNRIVSAHNFPFEGSIFEAVDEDMDNVDALSSSSESSLEFEHEPSIRADKSPDKQIEQLDDNDTNLYPLPHKPVHRDFDIPICNHPPPSILGFVRKNMGKDLSTIAMPVDMNEPLSTLQKYSEIIEYCDLINNAVQPDFLDSSGEKILRIAAFAVSYLSSVRVKERNNRKPFNPLLGETFELVKEDFGIRLISEKVSHRPPVFAMFVENENWTFSFSPSPNQKFWGKNFEIITKGVAKLTIKSTGEVFSWTQPATLLKNIIAGEKYSEPSSTMTIKSSIGYKAVVEFAKGGIFSGRSEELTIKAYDSSKKQLPYTVSGKWTESLTLKTNTTEKLIWEVGQLVPNSTRKFGFTKLAGTLNKITEIEKDNLPPTDSRLRPDMKVYENGEVEEAERLKIQLEEAQRARRKEMEEAGKTHTPFFFKHIGVDSPDSGEWVYIRGDKSYWNRRKNKDWDDLPRLW